METSFDGFGSSHGWWKGSEIGRYDRFDDMMVERLREEEKKRRRGEEEKRRRGEEEKRRRRSREISRIPGLWRCLVFRREKLNWKVIEEEK